jgi:hypothetical protein
VVMMWSSDSLNVLTAFSASAAILAECSAPEEEKDEGTGPID